MAFLVSFAIFIEKNGFPQKLNLSVAPEIFRFTNQNGVVFLGGGVTIFLYCDLQGIVQQYL